MRRVKGNIWDFYNQNSIIAIPTNGTVKRNGEAVMGRGVALQARKKFPDLPEGLGACIKRYGNRVVILDGPTKLRKMVSFPVKHNWWEKADLKLIEESAKQLASLCPQEEIYLPRVGCGNGKLDWKDVKPILEKYFDDRFIIVELE